MKTPFAIALLAAFLLGASRLAAQSTQPAGDRLTAAQLRQYLDTEKDWLAISGKIFQDAAAAKTDYARTAVVGDLGQKYQACLDKHHMTRQQFAAVAQRAVDAWSVLSFIDGDARTSRAQMDATEQQLNESLAAARQQLATYTQAQQAGARILSDEDRTAIVVAAQETAKSQREEAKRYAEDAAAAEADAVQHEADAKAAEDAANNPPFDVSADGRAEYVLNKRNEARAARASAAEARVEEADSKKSQALAEAAADAAQKRAEHPEIAITEDEKAQAKSDNAAAILAANKTIADDSDQLQKLTRARADLNQTVKAMSAEVPPENLDVMRQFADEYRQTIAPDQNTANHPGAS